MDLVPRLRELGVREVWIRYRQLEFLEEIIDENLGERQREVYCHVRSNFERVMNDTTIPLDFPRFQTSIRDMFDFLRQSTRSNILLQKLDAYDNYLMSHSTNVCYLALLVGMRLERYLIDERRSKSAREAKDLQSLGLGCLLHDVGKLRVATEILHKPGKLTDPEMEIIKRHPGYGYAMVKGRVPAAAADVVLNHHQRFCGGGYPQPSDRRTGALLPALAGKKIPIFSRIATIADIYDAATSKRCYSRAKPPVQVLHEMRTHCKGFFDPIVARAFFETIPPFPIGQVVMLSDGMEAAVVDFNPKFPVRPKVQCLRTPGGERIVEPSLAEVDLAIHPDLQIATIDGVDVRAYQTSQQGGLKLSPSLALV